VGMGMGRTTAEITTLVPIFQTRLRDALGCRMSASDAKRTQCVTRRALPGSVYLSLLFWRGFWGRLPRKSPQNPD